MDSFRESMDSFSIVVMNPDSKKICLVWWLTNPTSQICESRFASPILKDSNRGLVSWPELPKIWPVFTNPHKSWRILSTIAQNESLGIQAGGFAKWNKQSEEARSVSRNAAVLKFFFLYFFFFFFFFNFFSKKKQKNFKFV